MVADIVVVRLVLGLAVLSMFILVIRSMIFLPALSVPLPVCFFLLIDILEDHPALHILQRRDSIAQRLVFITNVLVQLVCHDR